MTYVWNICLLRQDKGLTQNSCSYVFLISEKLILSFVILFLCCPQITNFHQSSYKINLGKNLFQNNLKLATHTYLKPKNVTAVRYIENFLNDRDIFIFTDYSWNLFSVSINWKISPWALLSSFHYVRMKNDFC